MPVTSLRHETAPPEPLPAEIAEAIARGMLDDPFGWLGLHMTPGGARVVAFDPGAERARVVDSGGATLGEMERVHDAGVFLAMLPGLREPVSYRLEFEAEGRTWRLHDAYSFGPILGELDLHLIAEGRHQQLYCKLGAHPMTINSVEGTCFSVWAPNARRVSVVGDFNFWDGRRNPMRRRHEAGVFEIFIPGATYGTHYKFEVLDAHGHLQPLKADPMAFYQQPAPNTASVVHGLPPVLDDADWAESRSAAQTIAAPISIYEVHAGSWRRNEDGSFMSWDRIGDELIPYLQDMGFTHVEFLPISEHPFTGSWGYQPVGLFAPTSRYGDPEGLQRLVRRCHEGGIGVIVDWVPAHFPSDPHGLGLFDGSHLYEHADPRQGFHKDWNTLIYNYGRREVQNFLVSNALFWLERYGIDALRVDAVASMLYLDYSRNEGEWVPNVFGGRENLDAIHFVRETNRLIAEKMPGRLTIAEESTAFPGVSKPADQGGLGFDFKWNMGWMHDTLSYMAQDPVHRRYHHHLMTFGMHYAYSENFILPLSHDEVVHGKGSLVNKMPGDAWQKFANLRAYFGFMWTHPGKKLLFMGGEIAQWREWDHDGTLDWHLLGDERHRGMQRLVRDLNRLYRTHPSLHALDCDPAGFSWVEGGDTEHSVFSFERRDGQGRPVVVVGNFTPVVRHDYWVGVPAGGNWREILNTDAAEYGGSGIGNGGRVEASDTGAHGRPHALRLTLPPLGLLVLEPEG